MEDPKKQERQETSLEPQKSPKQQTPAKELDPTRTKTRRAIKNLNLDSTVKEKDLLSPFMQKLVDLEKEMGFVGAVKKLQRTMPRFIGFSIQQWYEIYMNTRPNSKLHQKALEMMERLEFDARSLEEMQILYTISQPESQLRKEMQERMSRIK